MNNMFGELLGNVEMTIAETAKGEPRDSIMRHML
jgi:hypothetical protein